MKKLFSIVLATVMLVSTVAFVPAQAANFEGGTVFSTYAGETVTLLPDYDADLNKDRALVLDGGFETKAAFNDDLQKPSYWIGGAFSYSDTEYVQGKTSLVLDYSLSGKEQSEMAWYSVFLEPSEAQGMAYCLEFYTKLLTPLDGNPDVMLYFMDSNGAQPSTIAGLPKFNINANTMAGTEWENQKWVRVRHYFVTAQDMNEAAYTFQIQDMVKTASNNKIAIDAVSVTKVYIDEETMDPSLFSQPEPVVKKSVKFAKKNVKVKKGKTVILKVTVKGANKAKFSVDKKGKKVVKLSKKKAKSVTVKGLKKGKATITAKVGAKKATCKVTVK